MGEPERLEQVKPIRPGDRVLRRGRRPKRRLRLAPNIPGILKFVKEIITQTPFLPILSVLVVLWLIFSAGIYFVEHETNEYFSSYGDALLWGLTSIQTMGSPHSPISSMGKVLHGVWIVVGTMLFWGAIIASVTSYFMRPSQQPTKQIIATLQYNLGILDELSDEELETLKATTEGLIETRLKQLRGSNED